jgi:hypothetical protein
MPLVLTEGTRMATKSHQITKIGWRPLEFAEAVGLSRATVYELMADGKIRSIKHAQGKHGARIITTSPAEYLASFENISDAL